MVVSIAALVLCSCFNLILSVNILAVFPSPSNSHHQVFKKFVSCHVNNKINYTVVSTANPGDYKLSYENITEIDVRYLFDMDKQKVTEKRKKMLLKSKTVSVTTFLKSIHTMMKLFEQPDIEELLKTKNTKFDLVITEAFYNIPMILAHIYKVPLIRFSSFYGLSNDYHNIGSPRHPLFYPSSFRNRIHNLSYLEKIYECFIEIRFWYYNYLVSSIESDLLKEKFGNATLSIDEVKELVDVLFVNVNRMLEGNRPMPANAVYLGAVHIEPVKELPEDINHFLDNSSNGVIYVSFGTVIHPSFMDPNLILKLIESFDMLPYNIIWKFDEKRLMKIKKSKTKMMIRDWFPQRNLLAHPNIKAFVTHAGLHSTTEAIDANVPLVGIPVAFDQYYNAEKYEHFKIGVKFDANSMTAEELAHGIKIVIENKEYQKNIKSLSILMRDQPQSPLERAVWWTEYVLRHGGAKHFRSPAANISWVDYLVLDLLVCFLIVYVLFVCLLIFLLIQLRKFVYRLIKTSEMKLFTD